MHAAIVGNGRVRPSRALREALQRTDLLICADGGVRVAYALKRPPHIVIGDFDSAGARMLQWARRHGAALLRFPTDKDKTDTELAIHHALDAGVAEIDLYGVLGGRVDHALANVGLLTLAAQRGCRARLLEGPSEIYLAGTKTRIAGVIGDLVSLLPVSDVASGVTTNGLKYPLLNGTLRLGSTLGVSNEISVSPASVTVGHGMLLVIVTHRGGRAGAR